MSTTLNIKNAGLLPLLFFRGKKKKEIENKETRK